MAAADAPQTEDVAVVPYDDEDDGVSSSTWPRQHALAGLWEDSFEVRHALRETGKILRWPKVELTGIATLSALSLNKQAVQDTLTIWASHNHDEAKSPPVDWLKDEAWFGQNPLQIIYHPLKVYI